MWEDLVEVKLWGLASFAEAWFTDALQEARAGQGRHSRRREIVFAVCFAESYLFEFVRDHVFSGQYDALSDYFPHKDRRGIRERWKAALKKLHRDGRLKAIPDFSRDPNWSRLRTLVDYRDGLIHAKASRPATSNQKEEDKPLPSPEDLDELDAGWAVKTVAELARSLHSHADIPMPTWLVEP